MSKLATRSRPTSRAFEELKAKIGALAYSLHHVLPHVISDVERVASTSSPSSAFQKIQFHVKVKRPKTLPTELLMLSKLTRWLAIVRRDHGDQAFAEALSLVKQLASRQAAPPQKTTSRKSMQQTLPALSRKEGGITAGIYKFGSYDWLAETRIEKLNELVKDLKGFEQLAIEIFHSLYLINTELAEERVKQDDYLKALAEAMKPLRESGELRKNTVMDELLSLKLTAEMIQKVRSELEEEGFEGWDAEKTVATVKKVLKECAKEALKQPLEEYKAAEEVFKGFLKGVGNVEIKFDEKVRLIDLLSKYTVFLGNFRELLKTRPETLTGEGIEFKGYQVGGDVSKIRPIEFAYPGEIQDYKLATRTYMTRRYEAGVQRGKGKRYIVLIDKSGSMSGQKIEWAKAVSLMILAKKNVDDIGIMFFDYSPYPDEPIWVKKNPIEALRKLVKIEAGGDTSIMDAVEKASEYDCDIILITDGIDYIDVGRMKELLKGRRLISFYIDGWNEDLAKASTKTYSVKADKEGAKTILRAV